MSCTNAMKRRSSHWLVTVTAGSVLIGGLLLSTRTSEPTGVDDQGLRATTEGLDGLESPEWAPARRGVIEPPASVLNTSDKVNVSLLVVSAHDFTPLARSNVQIGGLSRDPVVAEGGEDGRIQIEIPAGQIEEGCIAIVTAPGHCRRMLALYPTGDEVVIALAPASRITVRLVDEHGEAANGILLSLLPPDKSGQPWYSDWQVFDPHCFGPDPVQTMRWLNSAAQRGHWITARKARIPYASTEDVALTLGAPRGREFGVAIRDALDHDEWSQRTDAAGLATWEGVPTGMGYRWGARNAQVISYTPEAEVIAGTFGNGQLVVSSNTAAEDISGPFAVERGASTDLQGVIAMHTGLFGSVPYAEPEPPRRVVVKLFHRASAQEALVHGYDSLSVEQTGWASPEGDFEMHGVRPGSKVLRAWWREAGDQVFFAQSSFELLPGRFKNIGELLAQQGLPVDVAITLVDTMGNRLAVQDHINIVEEGELTLTVLGWDGTETSFPSLDARINARLGASLSLQGVPIGNCTMSLGWNANFEGPKQESVQLVLPPDLRFTTDDTTQVELEVLVRQVVQQGVTARFPPSVMAVRSEMHLVSTSGGQVLREDLRTNRDGTASTGSLGVEAGNYRLLVHTQTLEEAESVESWFGVYEGPLGDGHVEILMQQAASLDGIALSAEGVPLSNKLLFFSSGAHLDAPRTGWTHKVRTRDDGSFLLKGLEPDHVYYSIDELSFRSGPAGSHETQTLKIP